MQNHEYHLPCTLRVLFLAVRYLLNCAMMTNANSLMNLPQLCYRTVMGDPDPWCFSYGALVKRYGKSLVFAALIEFYNVFLAVLTTWISQDLTSKLFYSTEHQTLRSLCFEDFVRLRGTAVCR